jgi:peptidoglycan/xylan/chitin deacetylase (PgdA/CDA1 family)
MRGIFYHSVVEKRDPENYYTYGAVEVKEFEAHAAELARSWQVLSLQEISEHLWEGRKLPERAVHITFDDGFRNNLIAAEILDRYRLPWTLFVVADAVLNGFQPWYLRLVDAVTTASKIIQWSGRCYDLSQFEGKVRFSKEVKAVTLSALACDHLALLEEILRQNGLERRGESRWPFLSLDELRQLCGAGIEIGNHSSRHPNLARCSPEELFYEVTSSRERLQSALGCPIRFFSYPDGRYNRAVISQVRQEHELAVATQDPAQPDNIFELQRFTVGPRLEDLRSALSQSYPLKLRAKRLKRSIKKRIKQAAMAVGCNPEGFRQKPESN